jgi:hypothetical protein
MPALVNSWSVNRFTLKLFIICFSIFSAPAFTHSMPQTPIFNEIDLTGWKIAGSSEFTVSDKILRARGGFGILWYSQKTFKDFHLTLEFQTSSPTDNSGVFFRFPDLNSGTSIPRRDFYKPGGDPWIAVNQGYEVQINESAHPQGLPIHSTGAIYNEKGPDQKPILSTTSWNKLEILALGQEIQVILNGKRVNTFTGNKSLTGHIGIQSHDPASKVDFRNIKIREIVTPLETASKFLEQ